MSCRRLQGCQSSSRFSQSSSWHIESFNKDESEDDGVNSVAQGTKPSANVEHPSSGQRSINDRHANPPPPTKQLCPVSLNLHADSSDSGQRSATPIISPNSVAQFYTDAVTPLTKVNPPPDAFPASHSGVTAAETLRVPRAPAVVAPSSLDVDERGSPSYSTIQLSGTGERSGTDSTLNEAVAQIDSSAAAPAQLKKPTTSTASSSDLHTTHGGPLSPSRWVGSPAAAAAPTTAPPASRQAERSPSRVFERKISAKLSSAYRIPLQASGTYATTSRSDNYDFGTQPSAYAMLDSPGPITTKASFATTHLPYASLTNNEHTADSINSPTDVSDSFSGATPPRRRGRHLPSPTLLRSQPSNVMATPPPPPSAPAAASVPATSSLSSSRGRQRIAARRRIPSAVASTSFTATPTSASLSSWSLSPSPTPQPQNPLQPPLRSSQRVPLVPPVMTAAPSPPRVSSATAATTQSGATDRLASGNNAGGKDREVALVAGCGASARTGTPPAHPLAAPCALRPASPSPSPRRPAGDQLARMPVVTQQEREQHQQPQQRPQSGLQRAALPANTSLRSEELFRHTAKSNPSHVIGPSGPVVQQSTAIFTPLSGTSTSNRSPIVPRPASLTSQPPPETLQDYLADMASPNKRKSFTCQLLCIGVCCSAIPLCSCVLLFGLHYWAVTVQEKSYLLSASHPHTGSMPTTSFTLLLGILLSAVVFGVGGGLYLYLLAYRRAIRYQRRAFELCTRLPHAESPLDVDHLVHASLHGGTSNQVMIDVDDTSPPLVESAYPTRTFSKAAFRWHKEVTCLTHALTAPVSRGFEMGPLFSSPDVRSLASPQELFDGAMFNTSMTAFTPRATAAAAAAAATMHGGVAAGSSFIPHSLHTTPIAATSNRGSQRGGMIVPGSGDRGNDMVFSRRPQHPVDGSRLQDVVTVVACRFIVPASLRVDHNPIPRQQLLELQDISLQFHTRLRSAVHGAGLHQHAYMTECGLSEVVFSFNTVLPMHNLVVTSAAVLLAVAARNALTDWAPMHQGQRVRWGVAVHRFGALLRPPQRRSGRLYISFGSDEYGFTRKLAQLAALCSYGALCHADFFTDAMNETTGVPVDNVMDLTGHPFLVYQLQDGAESESDKEQLTHALTHMRNGDYTLALALLREWIRAGGTADDDDDDNRHDSNSDGAASPPVPAAALHLLYVAQLIQRAVDQSGPMSLYSAGDLATSVPVIPGFSEWEAMPLVKSYCRPAPVWEEGTDTLPYAPLQLPPASSTSAAFHAVHIVESFISPAAATAALSAAAPPLAQRTGNLALPSPVFTSSILHSPSSSFTNVLSHWLPRTRSNQNQSASNSTPVLSVSHEQTPINSVPLPSSGGQTPMHGSKRRRLVTPLPVDTTAQPSSGLPSPRRPLQTVPPPAPAIARISHIPVIMPQLATVPSVDTSSTASPRSRSAGTLAPHAMPHAGQEDETSVFANAASAACDVAESAAAYSSVPPAVRVLAPQVFAAASHSASADAFGAQIVSSNSTGFNSSTNTPTKELYPHHRHHHHHQHPQRPSILLTSGSLQLDSSKQLRNPTAAVNGGGSGSGTASAVRRMRRDSVGGKSSNRSRARSCSQLFSESPDDHPRDDVFVGITGGAVASQDMTRSGHMDQLSHDCLSLQSASSTLQSASMRQRVQPLPGKQPLFSDSTLTLPGGDRGGGGDEGSVTDVASLAEIAHERSMTSVVQRSRSMLGIRAASMPVPMVLCTRIRCISKGLTGMTCVYQGFHPNGYLVAIKRVDKRSQKQVDLERNEIQLLQCLCHPNIVHFSGEWEDETAIYMVMEYACDTLTSVLRKFNRLMPGVVRHYARGIFSALDYLHRKWGIIHRDLSPNNIIVTNTSDRSQVKLIDFGLSRKVALFRTQSVTPATLSASTSHVSAAADSRSDRSGDTTGAEIHASVAGTPLFMSPQACQGLVHPANDIWSAGIIMYLCLTGAYPYPTESFVDPDTFIRNVESGKLTPVLGDRLAVGSAERDFVEQCLKLNHTERPSASELLEHRFMIVS